MTEFLKRKVIEGFVWSAIERFSLRFVQFAVNIIMARLLLPSDFGIIAILSVFLQISQSFIDCGFTDALIRQQDRTERDFSTAFYFNIVISVFFYFILFISAHWISEFYDMPILVLIIRVIAINLIIMAFSAIHRVKLNIELDFKTQAKISFVAALFSGIIGIGMAYYEFGVWALVTQTILNSLLATLLLYYFVSWVPLCTFSVQSFTRLFSFGSKLLLSSLISRTYSNLYPLVIGRNFSTTVLGCFTNANQLASFPSSNLCNVISRVMYPVLSSIQNDNVLLVKTYRKYIRMASYIIFPLMMGLLVLSSSIIHFLLTDKWNGAIVLLQILCLDWMFDHVSAINLNLLYVKGRSDLALRLEIIKKIIATSILFISLLGGIYGICWGRVVYSLIATYLNTYYTKTLTGISVADQAKDVLPYFLLALVMGGAVFLSSKLFSHYLLQLLVGVSVGIVSYSILSILFCKKSLMELRSLIYK